MKEVGLLISIYPACFATQNRKKMANGYFEVVYLFYFPMFFCLFNFAFCIVKMQKSM